MNILMVTNTYLPHVGGVARSVESFSLAYRREGHRVLIVAPEFDDMPEEEDGVVRVPAVQDFQGSGFSVALPIPGLLSDTLAEFRPEIVHSHHPYLLGMTAMRVARFRSLPLVFTHHTLYEQYTHYVTTSSSGFRRFVAELATEYANLCDHVFAPSESVAALLRRRGVDCPIEVLPTGIELAAFRTGDRRMFRARHDIPDNAFVVGHLGRLAPEKNLDFLARAVAAFLAANPRAIFLVVGTGPSGAAMKAIFYDAGVLEQTRFAGLVKPPSLADAYHAMDVFAFSSKTETQGMVLTEAMAAGVPVIGLDASGVREVVSDGGNGRLLKDATPDEFAAALSGFAALPATESAQMRAEARRTAEAFSMPRMASRALACYEALRKQAPAGSEHTGLDRLLDLLKAEWQIVKGMAEAARFGLGGGENDEPTLQ